MTEVICGIPSEELFLVSWSWLEELEPYFLKLPTNVINLYDVFKIVIFLKTIIKGSV